MTTTWILIDTALGAAVTAIVAVPAVLIPRLLDRDAPQATARRPLVLAGSSSGRGAGSRDLADAA